MLASICRILPQSSLITWTQSCSWSFQLYCLIQFGHSRTVLPLELSSRNWILLRIHPDLHERSLQALAQVLPLAIKRRHKWQQSSFPFVQLQLWNKRSHGTLLGLCTVSLEFPHPIIRLTLHFQILPRMHCRQNSIFVMLSLQSLDDPFPPLWIINPLATFWSTPSLWVLIHLPA